MMDEYEVVPIDGEMPDDGDVIPTEDEEETAVIDDAEYDPTEPTDPDAPGDTDEGAEPEPEFIIEPDEEDVLPTEDEEEAAVIDDEEWGGGDEPEPDINDNEAEITMVGAVREGDVFPALKVGSSLMGFAPAGWGDRMQSEVDLASQAAEEAKAVAEATGQHFWEDSNGAHVTEITKEDWQAEEAKPNPFADVSDQKPYHNLLMNSLGILLRTALKNLVSITRSAIAFFDGQGNGAANVVASFGRDGAQIGRQGGYHTSIGVNRFGLLYDIDRLFEVSADGQKVDIYAGGSTMAGGTKYSNAEAAAIFDLLYDTCHGVAGSDIVYVTETNRPSGYRFYEPLPLSGAFMIDVVDQDGDRITSGDMDGVFYDGDVTAEWNSRTGMWDLVVDARFVPNINFDPQAETAGVTRIIAGDTELVFTEGHIDGPTPPASDDSAKLATTEWVNDLFDSFPLVQRGTVSPASHAASSSGSSAIAFADEFSASPTVIVGIRGQTQTEGIGRCSAWASNVSATGFTLNFRNDFTSSRTFGAYWVAVGGGTAGGSGGGGDTSALEQRIAELEADMQALAEATAYVGANHISIEGTTVSDALNPITSGTIDTMEV